MSQCEGNAKNPTAEKLDHLEDRLDTLRSEMGNLCGKLNWVSFQEPHTLESSDKPEEPTRVTSKIVNQLTTLIDKTNESINLARKMLETLEV